MSNEFINIKVDFKYFSSSNQINFDTCKRYRKHSFLYYILNNKSFVEDESIDVNNWQEILKTHSLVNNK